LLNLVVIGWIVAQFSVFLAIRPWWSSFNRAAPGLGPARRHPNLFLRSEKRLNRPTCRKPSPIGYNSSALVIAIDARHVDPGL